MMSSARRENMNTQRIAVRGVVAVSPLECVFWERIQKGMWDGKKSIDRQGEQEA